VGASPWRRSRIFRLAILPPTVEFCLLRVTAKTGADSNDEPSICGFSNHANQFGRNAPVNHHCLAVCQNSSDKLETITVNPDKRIIKSMTVKIETLRIKNIGEDCGGPVSSDRFFGFLSGKIIQFVVVEAVEM